MMLKELAGPTRFELATSGVTGRRSNQLNYDPATCESTVGPRPSVLPASLAGLARDGLDVSRSARHAREGWWAVQDSNL